MKHLPIITKGDKVTQSDIPNRKNYNHDLNAK
jgi:hypothetical protein